MGLIENIGFTGDNLAHHVLNNIFKLGLDFIIVPEHNFNAIPNDYVKNHFPNYALFIANRIALILNLTTFELCGEPKLDNANSQIFAKTVIKKNNLPLDIIAFYTRPYIESKISACQSIIDYLVNRNEPVHILGGGDMNAHVHYDEFGKPTVETFVVSSNRFIRYLFHRLYTMFSLTQMNPHKRTQNHIDILASSFPNENVECKIGKSIVQNGPRLHHAPFYFKIETDSKILVKELVHTPEVEQYPDNIANAIFRIGHIVLVLDHPSSDTLKTAKVLLMDVGRTRKYVWVCNNCINQDHVDRKVLCLTNCSHKKIHGIVVKAEVLSLKTAQGYHLFDVPDNAEPNDLVQIRGIIQANDSSKYVSFLKIFQNLNLNGTTLCYNGHPFFIDNKGTIECPQEIAELEIDFPVDHLIE